MEMYADQIQEIAMFAKRINYNIDNGVKELVRLWIVDGQKTMNFIQDNKKEVQTVLKQFL
jgi:hypothetical protein